MLSFQVDMVRMRALLAVLVAFESFSYFLAGLKCIPPAYNPAPMWRNNQIIKCGGKERMVMRDASMLEYDKSLG